MPTDVHRLALIVAYTRNGRVIGNGPSIPWHYPEDLKRFKILTSGHAIIMGRKTWDSLPRKPLPNRANFIVSTQPDFKAEGARVFSNFKDAFDAAIDIDDELPFVIGGRMIYLEALPYISEMYVTEVLEDHAGDVIFPGVDEKDWEVTSERTNPEGTLKYVNYSRKGWGFKAPAA